MTVKVKVNVEGELREVTAYTLGELSKALGLSRATIISYEQKGIFHKPILSMKYDASFTGKARLYSYELVQELKRIKEQTFVHKRNRLEVSKESIPEIHKAFNDERQRFTK